VIDKGKSAFDMEYMHLGMVLALKKTEKSRILGL